MWAYILLIAGSALFAIGDVMFVNPYLMAPGGTYGISNVLNTLWPWKISFYAICMDVPLLIIGTWILGPKFGFKTILSTALIFLFTLVLESTWGYRPVIYDYAIGIQDTEMASAVRFAVGDNLYQYFVPDYFLNTVVAGLIYGVAIGMIFRSGATSGGSDIISMILHKYTKISLGTLVMIVDGFITLSDKVAVWTDDADKTLLMRVPYYGIGISLPFILMRHWDEWQESKTLSIDDMDKRLCRIAMDIQYRCQQFFFGEMAHHYFEDQTKEFVPKRRSTKYEVCFRKLPDEFKMEQFVSCFGCSSSAASKAVSRFLRDGYVEKVKFGVYKKVMQELR